MLLLLLLLSLRCSNSFKSWIHHSSLSITSLSSLSSLSSVRDFEQRYSKHVSLGIVNLVVLLSIHDKALAAEVPTTTLDLMSDEIMISVDPQANIGIGLNELKEIGNRIVVTSIKDSAPLTVISTIKPGYILVALENKLVEGFFTKDAIGKAIKNAKKTSITMVFRDPNKFFDLLNTTSLSSPSLNEITTRIYTTNSNHVLRVQRMDVPTTTNKVSAKYGDVVEVLYQARKLDGTVVEEADNKNFFVLGSFASTNKPALSSSPGFVLAMKGMVPGEKRRVTCPPPLLTKALQYAEDIVFVVTLLSLNGQK